MQLGTKVGIGTGDIVLDGDPASPNFRPTSIVDKRSPISATAEQLFVQSTFFVKAGMAHSICG